MKNENEVISLLIEIDPEKKAVYLNDYSSEKNINGFAKRFKNKKDIVRLFSNYLYEKVDLFLEGKDEKYRYEYRKNKRKNFRKR